MNTLKFKIERIDKDFNILIILNGFASYNLSNIVSFDHLLEVALSCAKQFLDVPAESQITNKEAILSQYSTFESAIGAEFNIEYI